MLYICMVIYDYMWLYMVIYGHEWLYMVIYGYTWLYTLINMVIYGTVPGFDSSFDMCHESKIEAATVYCITSTYLPNIMKHLIFCVGSRGSKIGHIECMSDGQVNWTGITQFLGFSNQSIFHYGFK